MRATEPPFFGSSATSIGSLIQSLRLARGLSQLRLAEVLCDAAGSPTVSRHEVSRWERNQRIPGCYWLHWLAVALDVPLERLEAAAAAARQLRSLSIAQEATTRSLESPQLVAMLESSAPRAIRDVAHWWLAFPQASDERPPKCRPSAAPAQRTSLPPTLDGLASRLPMWRRLDDQVTSRMLADRVRADLRTAIAALEDAETAARSHTLRLVAEYAQLAGWILHEVGERCAGRRAYMVALRVAAETGDRQLGAFTLAALSHQTLAAGDPHEALLLAQSGRAGLRRRDPALLVSLLSHRVAFAAASQGERRAAESALGEADRAADRHDPSADVDRLYWLNPAELAAMTGRCLVLLGRPLRAAKLLAAAPYRDAGPRTVAIYRTWLARSYLEIGEIEEACRVAASAMLAGRAAGSTRAVSGLRHTYAQLLSHRDIPAVQRFERHTAGVANPISTQLD